MPNKTWKTAERRVGKMIGSTREGPTGETGFDLISEDLGLGVEVKYRKKLPKWLWDFVLQAEDAGAGTELDPVVVMVEKGKQEGDFLCVLRFRDYVRLRKDGVNVFTYFREEVP